MSFDQDRRRRTYELPFRPYPGLTVWVRKPSFAALESLTDAVAHLGEDLSGDRLATPEKLRWWGVLFRAFAASLVGWDLIDRGVAVPATVDGVLAQDHPFLMALSHAWYYAVVLRSEDEPAQPDTPPAPEPPDDVDEIEAQLADIPVTVTEPDLVSA
jgi:hypothetical protein